MNARNICRLANFIANEMNDKVSMTSQYDYQSGNVFDMQLFLATLSDDEDSPCGTAACIAGSIELMEKKFLHNGLSSTAISYGSAFLGLTMRQSEELFTPNDIFVRLPYRKELSRFKWQDIKRKHAVFVLRNMATKRKIVDGLIYNLWKRAFRVCGP